MPAKKTTEIISDSSPVATEKPVPVAVEIQDAKTPLVPDKLSVYETALKLIANMGDMQRAGDAIVTARKALNDPAH